jgi:hypothetical protein
VKELQPSIGRRIHRQGQYTSYSSKELLLRQEKQKEKKVEDIENASRTCREGVEKQGVSWRRISRGLVFAEDYSAPSSWP